MKKSYALAEEKVICVSLGGGIHHVHVLVLLLSQVEVDLAHQVVYVAQGA